MSVSRRSTAFSALEAVYSTYHLTGWDLRTLGAGVSGLI